MYCYYRSAALRADVTFCSAKFSYLKFQKVCLSEAFSNHDTNDTAKYPVGLEHGHCDIPGFKVLHVLRRLCDKPDRRSQGQNRIKDKIQGVVFKCTVKCPLCDT